MPANAKQRKKTIISDDEGDGTSEEDRSPPPPIKSGGSSKNEAEALKSSMKHRSTSGPVDITDIGGLTGLASIISALAAAGAQLRGKVDDSGRYELEFDLTPHPRVVEFNPAPGRHVVHRRNSKESGTMKRILSM